MIKVGLIGFGKWGKILHEKLVKISEVVFVYTSKDNYQTDMLLEVDWVVVATPDRTHYEIVKYCLQRGVNVFCEKPLTLTYKQSKELFDIAVAHSVRLYVNDVQNYHDYNFPINEYNFIKRRKSGGGNLLDALYRLAYHDIYTLYNYLQGVNFSKVEVLDKQKTLHFIVDDSFEFLYDINATNVKHSINEYSLSRTDDVLTVMLIQVFSNKADFNYNQQITLFTIRIIQFLKKAIFNQVAVAGGGIFGCTAAWMLSKEGYQVTLYEQNDDLISQASLVNQYRLHKGYHYPRSKDTALSSKQSEESFADAYGDCIVNGNVHHYYSIASENSFVSSDEYLAFLNEVGLDYKVTDAMSGCDLTVLVREKLFDPEQLRKACWKYLHEHNVEVLTNTEMQPRDVKEYDHVINATYSNINYLSSVKKDYQFELCEKPVVKLSDEYQDKSIVVMDGPFMCIDPLGKTGYHVMGNVVHAIHETNIGRFPKCHLKYNNVLNKGIVFDPPITNIDKFIDSAHEFFVDLGHVKHVGSMFTFRTVLPNREHDDARPTLVEKVDNKVFNIFSGKIGTCVQAVEEVLDEIR